MVGEFGGRGGIISFSNLTQRTLLDFKSMSLSSHICWLRDMKIYLAKVFWECRLQIVKSNLLWAYSLRKHKIDNLGFRAYCKFWVQNASSIFTIPSVCPPSWHFISPNIFLFFLLLHKTNMFLHHSLLIKHWVGIFISQSHIIQV